MHLNSSLEAETWSADSPMFALRKTNKVDRRTGTGTDKLTIIYLEFLESHGRIDTMMTPVELFNASSLDMLSCSKEAEGKGPSTSCCLAKPKESE